MSVMSETTRELYLLVPRPAWKPHYSTSSTRGAEVTRVFWPFYLDLHNRCWFMLSMAGCMSLTVLISLGSTCPNFYFGGGSRNDGGIFSSDG